MMMEESSTLKKDFCLLIQTGEEYLEMELSKSIQEKSIQLLSIDSSEDLNEQHQRGQIITMIIGSDIEDPVQSAQRLHAWEKNAKIILMAPSKIRVDALKEAIRYSPFIGTDVICLNESDSSDIESLKKIIQESLQAVKFRAIISKTNAQVTSSLAIEKQVLSQKFINKMMDFAPIGIVIVNRQGNVLAWNREASSIFKKNESQVLGTSFSRLFGHSSRNNLESYIRKSFESTLDPGLIETLELERKLKVGFRQFLNLTASLFAYSDDSENMLILAIKDVTEQKLAEEKLYQANHSLREKTKELSVSNAELEQFAFVASHDLQEPLRMITGFLSLIEKKYDSVLDEKGKEYIRFATDGAMRMRKIILDLLEFSRVGSLDLKRDEIKMNQLLEEVLALNNKLITENNAQIEIFDLPVVMAVQSSMRQLFQNLINNAIKYKKKDARPEIIISSSEDEHYWYFNIQDNGIGIHQEYTEKIFNIFQRLHSKDEYSGTGIGLAICKKIVEDHGGEITVESEEGKGSTFSFSIKKNKSNSG